MWIYSGYHYNKNDMLSICICYDLKNLFLNALQFHNGLLNTVKNDTFFALLMWFKELSSYWVCMGIYSVENSLFFPYPVVSHIFWILQISHPIEGSMSLRLIVSQNCSLISENVVYFSLKQPMNPNSQFKDKIRSN